MSDCSASSTNVWRPRMLRSMTSCSSIPSAQHIRGSTWNIGFIEGYGSVIWPEVQILPGVTMAPCCMGPAAGSGRHEGAARP